MKRTILLPLILLVTVLLFHPGACTKDKPLSAHYTEQASREIKASEAPFEALIATLRLRIKDMNTALQQTQLLLIKRTKEQSASEQQLQLRLLQTELAREKKESTKWFVNCDSLQQEAIAYTVTVNEKDSVQESMINQLQEQITVKDTMLLVKEQEYAYIRQQLQQSRTTSLALKETTAQQQKQLRRQRRNGLLKSAGIILLSGILLSRK